MPGQKRGERHGPCPLKLYPGSDPWTAVLNLGPGDKIEKMIVKARLAWFVGGLLSSPHQAEGFAPKHLKPDPFRVPICLD